MAPTVSLTWPPPPSILPSTFLLQGRYEILTDQLIAHSRNSQVYQGIDHSHNEFVAIKVQAYTAEKMNILALQKGLKAPHAVRCRDVFTNYVEQKIYIVMDLIPEYNICQVFFNPSQPTVRLSLDEITCILKQYLEFLKGWHSLADICHNLNASKLIYQRASRTLTVLDYGSARRAHLTDQSNPQTTINHQPPEFFLKRKNTAAVDRWGLGCILYYLLTGTDLFPLGSGISEEEQNHYVFQRIVQRIGWPTPQYLQKCQNTDVYFDDQRRFRKNLPVPRLQNWRVVIEQTFSLNNWPTHEMNGFISIIDNVVCYKNRSTPESLLKHRLFNNEIVLHLNYNPSLKCTMYIRRFSILNKPFEFLLPSDIFAADLTLDFKQPIDECLHIPRDPLGKYVVMLEKNGFFLLYGYDFNSDEPLDVRHIQEKLTFSKPLNNYGCRV